MIKVVALDLDGTLLRSDGTISRATIDALAHVATCGIRAVIVTARPPRFVKALAAHAGLTGLAICSNGAIVYDLDRDHVTVHGPLPVATARLAAAAIASVLPGAGFALETGWQAIIGPGYGHVARGFGGKGPGKGDDKGDDKGGDKGEGEGGDKGGDSRVAVNSDEQLWAATGACVKLLAWSAAPVTDAMLELVGRAVPAATTVTYSGAAGMLEVHAAGVSKVATLSALCAGWGVDAAQVAAFGDMPNDLPMLRWAGKAVAVANAHPSVTAVADEVTASNDDDGVALVLSRWESDGPAR